MKRTLLILSILGFIAPMYHMLKVTIETGNVLLWTKPGATIEGAFGNDVSTAFLIDLLYVVYVFIIWSWFDARKKGIKNVWIYWVLTFIFGLAGPLPLYLYKRLDK